MKNPKAIKNFGTQFRKFRESKNLSQQKLADMANINKGTIRTIENGLNGVSIDVLISIAIALEVPITDIVNFKIEK